MGASTTGNSAGGLKRVYAGGRAMEDEKIEYWPNGSVKSYTPGGTNKPPKVTETMTSGSTTKGKNLGAKEGDTSGMPKMEAGESSSAYSERVRKWRAAKIQRDAMKQK